MKNKNEVKIEKENNERKTEEAGKYSMIAWEKNDRDIDIQTDSENKKKKRENKKKETTVNKNRLWKVSS